MSERQCELTEEEQMRRAAFECLSCGSGLRVGAQYPAGVPIPRTLELWCPRCKTTSVLYQPAFWGKEQRQAA